MKIGDKVRISKDGEATEEFGLTWNKHDCLGKVGVVSDITKVIITKAMVTVEVKNGFIKHEVEWHIDDLTPLDPPSMALVQVGDVIKGEDGKYHFVYDTDNLKHQIFIISFLSNINGSLVSSEDETYDIADITAIYKGGNLDNIINQSVEGLELIWERAEEKSELIEPKGWYAQQENHEVLEKLTKIEADLAEVKLMIKG